MFWVENVCGLPPFSYNDIGNKCARYILRISNQWLDHKNIPFLVDHSFTSDTVKVELQMAKHLTLPQYERDSEEKC